MQKTIRDHIINNFKNDDIDTLRSAIEESIEEQDEVTLPGMGVFFEIVWQDSSNELKNQILNIIKNRLHN